MKPLILSIALVAFTSCGSGERATSNKSAATSSTQSDTTAVAQIKRSVPCLNLNIATADELIRLPGVGEVLARRIIDYRERHGRFRRSEDIIIIEGFSENKYRAIAGMICVD